VKIEHCPVCGESGSLTRTNVVIDGKKYGPYPAVQHYAGYDREKKRWKKRTCYIRVRRLDPNQKAQLQRLLRKHANI